MSRKVKLKIQKTKRGMIMRRNLRVSVLIFFILSTIFFSGCSSSRGTEQKLEDAKKTIETAIETLTEPNNDNATKNDGVVDTPAENISDPTVEVNVNANIGNDGLSLMQGDWIYFCNEGLYKIKTDGTGETLVSNNQVTYLNYFEDWIYYVDYSFNQGIYKIRLDGTDKTLILDTNVNFMIVSEGWIYYIDSSNVLRNRENLPEIFKMKTDGTENQKIIDVDGVRFNLSLDWIYYVNLLEQRLYKVKTDGTGNVKVFDEAIGSFNILGEYIYYTDIGEFGQSTGIWKMKLDGTDSVRLTEDIAKAINVSGYWIYYANVLNNNYDTLELKKISLDGTQAIAINDDDVININVHGDWLVYLNFDNTTNRIMMTIMKTDGTQRRDYEHK